MIFFQDIKRCRSVKRGKAAGRAKLSKFDALLTFATAAITRV